jgi:hypothetical protein
MTLHAIIMEGREPGFGTLLPHGLVGTVYLIVGVFLLDLTRKRAQGLNGRKFSDLYIPEQSPLILKRVSSFLVAGTVIGTAVEIIGGYFFCDHRPFFYLIHQTLYLGFFLAGVVLWLESKGRLPRDSGRSAVAMAFALGSILWYDHSMAKQDEVDRKIHSLLALLNAADAFSLAYSIQNPTCMLAYLASFALLICQALWMYTVGLHSCCLEYAADRVIAYFGLQVLAVFGMVVVVAAANGNHHSNAVTDKEQYARLSLTRMECDDVDDDDDDDTDASSLESP